MPHRKLLAGFVCRFAVIFGLFILPWPGWDKVYGQYFRAIGTLAFSRPDAQRVVFFRHHERAQGFSSLNTQMTLGNRALVDANGKGPGQLVDLDTRSIGWIPTALTAALILSTPVPWRRRCGSLLAGLVLIHAFILFSLQCWIWNMSPEVSLFVLTPWEKAVTDGLAYTLLTQLGASFSAPVVIWLFVTFRRSDLETMARAA